MSAARITLQAVMLVVSVAVVLLAWAAKAALFAWVAAQVWGAS